MAKRQTRRSISVKASTDLRISQFADDHKMSTSGFVEGIVEGKLGEVSSEEVTLYEAYEAGRAKQPPKPAASPEPTSPDSPKTGPDDQLPVTTKKRPKFNQPEPVKKDEGDDEVPEEMEGYIDPHLQF